MLDEVKSQPTKYVYLQKCYVHIEKVAKGNEFIDLLIKYSVSSKLFMIYKIYKGQVSVMRQVFFSFEYNKDVWRASQIRKMNVVSKSSTFSDNDWGTVKSKSEASIKKWINEQMAMRSCIVVLIGKTTSTRKWVKYEIEKAYELKKGIVGIYIHGLKNENGDQTEKGSNPFYNVFTNNGERLSKYVTCYDPPYKSSKFVYDDISNNIDDLIENAIENKPPQ